MASVNLSDTHSRGFHHLGKQTWLREPGREQESQLCLVTCRISFLLAYENSISALLLPL